MFTVPTPKSDYDAMRQAKAWEKAQVIAAELRKGGQYKAHINIDAPFSITHECYDAQDKYTGEVSYQIDLTAMPIPTCSCPAFQQAGDTCKHLLAVELALDMNERDEATEAQAKEYDAAQSLLEPYGYFSY